MESEKAFIENLSRDDISVSYVFQKMFSAAGKLVAVECLTRLHASLTPLSPEHFFSFASNAVREAIIHEQLDLVEAHKDWFNERQIYVTINLDNHTLTLLKDSAIIRRVKATGCIHFEVNEHSCSLTDNSPLQSATAHALPLWLDDFGSGYAGLASIRRHHFDYIKIDKDIFWYLMGESQGKQLMHSLLSFLHCNNYKVVVEGIENEQHQRWLAGMPWFALQGHYWKEVNIATLTAEPATVD
ncbi:EAL domain-containing protein [Winslowiella iniecta]|uniref:Diguanylate phosphodiesterase n=1 Tax=Winslowiella iniecta TaxID=1560201 RepID=A0A0L7SYL6_9GAMM|nr:EAL domain-containing protein [Winslowiella iniecta]KOC87713.1 diguanylate phosphodiesterase [Winslowiella iniecta]KOC88051.1 diguanylate phosphodiesterase [Winslowiella iniecta]